MKTTKIRKDFLGLFVVGGGWVARPVKQTLYKEGDEVRAHHFGGSPNVGVGKPPVNFRKHTGYEIWHTTGMYHEYVVLKRVMSEKEFKEYITAMYQIDMSFNINQCGKWGKRRREIMDEYWDQQAGRGGKK